MSTARIAILDMYNGQPNQGMRCIREILDRYNDLSYDIYDVRAKAEVPSLEYDAYLSTGGPGNPLEGDGHWDAKYYAWLQSVWTWNQREEQKKQVFFICHSFQMAVDFFHLASVTDRKSMSFGTFPVHMTDAGRGERNFKGLNNPFWAADFRFYQVVQPNLERFAELDAEILALEKIRPHIPLERAIMAIRFSPEMIGVQFHPEADPDGMLTHFMEPKRKDAVIAEHGIDKYHRMVEDLRHPKRIGYTHDRILPQFFEEVIAYCEERLLEAV